MLALNECRNAVRAEAHGRGRVLIHIPSQCRHLAAVRAGSNVLRNVFTVYGQHGRTSSYSHGPAALWVQGTA